MYFHPGGDSKTLLQPTHNSWAVNCLQTDKEGTEMAVAQLTALQLLSVHFLTEQQKQLLQLVDIYNANSLHDTPGP